MSEKAEQLKLALASLSLEDREGIRAYLDSLLEDEEPTQEQWDDYLLEVASQRLADFDAGRTKDIPWEVVDRRMKEKYG